MDYDTATNVKLAEKKEDLELRLEQLGYLYDGGREKLSTYQIEALSLSGQGYGIGEQIYDLYNELGHVMKEMEKVND